LECCRSSAAAIEGRRVRRGADDADEAGPEAEEAELAAAEGARRDREAAAEVLARATRLTLRSGRRVAAEAAGTADSGRRGLAEAEAVVVGEVL
jgi:hypothetical protein